MDPLDRVREVRVDDDLVDIGDDQQGWVEQGLAVLEELLVGSIQVGMLALVLPREVAPLPDVGPAVASALGVRTSLEGKGRAGGISFRWRGVADQVAQVDEMFLGAGAFLERARAPFLDKGMWGEAGRHAVLQ